MLDTMIPGTSDVAALVRAKDWSKHQLGPIETWPSSLRVALTTCFAARSPMQVWWGASAFTFYNDAFVPWIGAQHPDALGRRGFDIYGPRWQVRQNAIQRMYVDHRAVDVDGLTLMPIFEGTSIEGVVSTFADDRVGSDLMWAVDEAVCGPLHALARLSPVDEHLRDLVRGVDDLLDITRLARGKLLLDRASVDLQTLVADLVTAARSRAEAHKVALVCDANVTRLFVSADRKRVLRALSQLLFHAIDTSDGVPVRVAADRQDDTIRVHIVYSGDELPMLRRLPAQRIIELHEGTLAEQKVSASREIVVELPAAEKRAFDATPRAARILVVEDDDTNARTAQMALECLGYVVAVAHDGPVALAVARVFQPDAAVIDLRLPVIDGWEVARRLREEYVGLPVVAVTGMAGEQLRERSARAGFVDHFIKPLKVETLHRCLSTIPSLLRFTTTPR